MKRVLLPLLAITPLLAFGQTSVRVMSWNIARGIGANGPVTSEQPAIAKVVNYERPDVWVINEIGGNNSGFSASASRTALATFINSNVTVFGANPQLGVNYYAYVGSFDDNFITSAIVSRYPIASTQAQDDGLRGFYESTLTLPGSQSLGVFFTHLKALGTTTDAQTRQTEAEGDLIFMNSWKTSNPGKPFLLAGDFNESEDADNTANWSGGIGGTLPNGHVYHPITTLKSAGLGDGVPVSVRGRKETESSRNEPPTIRFDYNLFSAGVTFQSGSVFDTGQYTAGELSALNSANGTSFVAGDSSTASDHLPVIANYQLAPVPEPATLLFLGGGLAAMIARRRR